MAATLPSLNVPTKFGGYSAGVAVGELSDGTRAAVVEHAVVPQWELRVTKNGVVVEHERCDSFSALIAESMTGWLLTGAIGN